MVCEAWAMQGYGTPLAVYAAYAVKLALYVGGWLLCCRTTPGLGELGTIGAWWLHPIAFQKAILWSMLSRGWGSAAAPVRHRTIHAADRRVPLLPPAGHDELPLVRLPWIGGSRRTWLDVALYLALIVLLVRALLAPSPSAAHLVPIAAIVPVIGLADRTIFLALRAEHYWTTIVVLAASDAWLGGAKAVQLALWFWAGFSKLNRHFPTVVCVMISTTRSSGSRGSAAHVPPLPG